MTRQHRTTMKTVKLNPDVHRAAKTLVASSGRQALSEYADEAIIRQLIEDYGLSKVTELLSDAESLPETMREQFHLEPSPAKSGN